MSKSLPKYILVENHLRNAIKNKEFTHKLPGERTLAKELGVSYITARKAVDNLVNEGLLYKIPTKGTFVGEQKTNQNKSRTIGYFLDSSIESGISSPYYSLIFNSLERHAAKNGYSLVYFSEIDEQQPTKNLAKLDGVIASCFPRVEDSIQLIKQHVPVVVIDNSTLDKSISSVIIDNFNAVMDSINYACSLGHKRIGFMTGLEDSEVGSSRLAGYQSGLKKNKIELDEELIFHGNYSFNSGIEGARYFHHLETPPSIIICANDSMALGAMQLFNQEGLKVPDDISIIGFDDIDVASQITPALTTVAAPVQEIARHAFDILHSLIMHEQAGFQHMVLPARLVIRQSCAAWRNSDAA